MPDGIRCGSRVSAMFWPLPLTGCGVVRVSTLSPGRYILSPLFFKNLILGSGTVYTAMVGRNHSIEVVVGLRLRHVYVTHFYFICRSVKPAMSMHFYRQPTYYGRPAGRSPKRQLLYKWASYWHVLRGHFSWVPKVAVHMRFYCMYAKCSRIVTHR